MKEQLFGEIGSSVPDNLIVGNEINLLIKGITIEAGQGQLKRGSVIGIVTATGKGKLCTKVSSDGSQEASVILADDMDTTEEVQAQCYQSGQFNRESLIFGNTDTAKEHEDELRKYNIFLKDSIEY